MIKIDMDMEKNTIREVSCQGDIMTILAELSFAIGQIYHDLHTLNPTAGNAFRKMVIRFHDNSDEVVIIRCVDGSTRRWTSQDWISSSLWRPFWRSSTGSPCGDWRRF